MARRPYYLKKKGRFWYVRWNRESSLVNRDQHHDRSTGETSRRAAETWCVQQIAKRRRITRETTLGQYLAPYYVWDECPHIKRLVTVGASIGKTHAASTRSRIERYILTHPIADIQLAELTRGDLIDFQVDLVRQGTGRRTVNQVLGALKVMFREAVSREDLDRDPSAHIENIRYEAIERGVFTLEELRLLFPATPPGPWRGLQEHTMFLLAWTCGMRKGELLALRWTSVDLERAAVRVEAARKELDGVGRPKWGRRREEPLCTQAVDRLRDLWDDSVYCAAEHLVFPDAAGRMHGNWWWHQRFVEALRTLGISDVERKARNLVPHGFRHCLVTFLRDKVDEAVLRDVVGHSSVAVTNDYTHFTLDQKRVVADTIDRLLE